MKSEDKINRLTVRRMFDVDTKKAAGDRGQTFINSRGRNSCEQDECPAELHRNVQTRVLTV